MTTYECPTCGQYLSMTADEWSWHRLVEHPKMGLPVHDPNLARVRALRRAPRRLVVAGPPPVIRQAHPIVETPPELEHADTIGRVVLLVLIAAAVVGIAVELYR